MPKGSHGTVLEVGPEDLLLIQVHPVGLPAEAFPGQPMVVTAQYSQVRRAGR